MIRLNMLARCARHSRQRRHAKQEEGGVVVSIGWWAPTMRALAAPAAAKAGVLS
jgi:hypothetical protein